MSVDGVFAGRLVLCPLCRDFVILPETEEGKAQLPSFELRSERLELRLAEPRDWKTLLPVLAHEANYKFELTGPSSAQSVRSMLKESKYPRGFRKSGQLRFILSKRSGGEVVGIIHLMLSQALIVGELGVMIHEPFQGQGFGGEAVQAVVDFAIGILNLQRVSAACDAKNMACRRLLLRCGFGVEGERKSWFYHRERGWVDSPQFALFHPRLCCAGERGASPPTESGSVDPTGRG